MRLIYEQFASFETLVPAQSIDDIVETWGYALDLDSQVADDVHAAMREDDELRRRVVDVLSEALTNVVRHGSSQKVEVRLWSESNQGVVLLVRNEGELTLGASGLGSEELGLLTTHWSRNQVDAQVVLVAHFDS
jgi:signal transduction histidine kinase